MTWVWEHSRSTKSDRLVLLAIADFAHDDGADAYPFIETLAQKCRLDERTVKLAIGRLVELGELVVELQTGGSARHEFYSPRHRPNHYRVVMDGPPDEDAEPMVGGPNVHPSGGANDVGVGGRNDADVGGRNIHPTYEEPSEGQPSVDPSGILTTPTRGNAGGTTVDDRGFDAFWEAYPRRNGKKLGRGDALKQWRRLKAPERDAAMVGVGHYAAACLDGQLAKDAFRWLRDRCWEDWQTPALPSFPRNGRPASTLDAVRAVAERECLW